MELASRAMDLATRALNSNAVINVLLVGAFATLSLRSFNQQRNIETLEMEKATLLKSNKAMKRAMWDWKQQLFADASLSPDTALVPLSRLKSIYGEAPAAAVQASVLTRYFLQQLILSHLGQSCLGREGGLGVKKIKP